MQSVFPLAVSSALPKRLSHWAACGLLLAGLTSCGGAGGGGSGATTPDTPTASSQVLGGDDNTTPAALKTQIAQLEASGTLPALDRSNSIVGPDVNNNGVRDDIEAYINRLPITPEQQRAALQTAKALQLTLTVDLADKVALQKVGDALMAAIKCEGKNFGGSSREEVSSKLQAMTANTRERTQRYLEYNAARSGSTTSWPSGDTCE